MTIYITNMLEKNGFKSDDMLEKVHIMIGIIDKLCHEIVYHKHKELNYDIMTELVINNIVKLLE